MTKNILIRFLIILGLIITTLTFAFFCLMFLFSIGGIIESQVESDSLTRPVITLMVWFLATAIQASAVHLLYKKWRALRTQ